MTMHLFVSYLILAAGLLLSTACLSFVLRLLRVDRIEGKKSAARTRSVRDAVMGRARIHEDWIPDARVKGGLTYNRRKKRLEISGRLSEESFDRVFR